jgi:hypothetical protein
MSEPENFLSRWLRRKHEADQKPDARDAEHAPDVAPPTTEAKVGQAAPDKAAGPEFDLSTLPSIESIDAGTDIRGFFQKGVPLELTRAALRRAWTADPAIRDFIEVAENQWDFATGSNLPGFGPLEMSDDVRRMVAEVFQYAKPVSEDAPGPASRPDPEAGPQAVASDGQSTPAGVADAPHAAIAADDSAATATPASAEIGVDFVHRDYKNGATQKEAKVFIDTRPIKGRHGGALPR